MNGEAATKPSNDGAEEGSVVGPGDGRTIVSDEHLEGCLFDVALPPAVHRLANRLHRGPNSVVILCPLLREILDDGEEVLR